MSLCGLCWSGLPCHSSTYPWEDSFSIRSLRFSGSTHNGADLHRQHCTSTRTSPALQFGGPKGIISFWSYTHQAPRNTGRTVNHSVLASLARSANAPLSHNNTGINFGLLNIHCLTGKGHFIQDILTDRSNTGIGKSAALDLAKRGARVILACRNKERAEAAVYEIRRESGSNQVVYMQLDLASLKSIRSFTETFLKTEPRLDILINNAGVIGPGRTEDGFGMAFGVNHLGHYYLTNLLLDRLKQCGPSRVVTVSALLHHLGNIDFPLLASRKDLVSGQSTWNNLQAYCNSKLCNVLFTRELANRLEGTKVTCYTLHPGVIHTELGRNMSRWQQLLWIPLAKLFFLHPEGGSQTTLHCALQEGIEPLSGRYFSNCALQQVGAKGRDDALAKKLWEVSERLTGL